MSGFSHFNPDGQSHMVDVGSKPITARMARASALVVMSETVVEAMKDKTVGKGDVLEVARLAGIMACKKTSDLIPLCHPLAIHSVAIQFDYVNSTTLKIEGRVEANDRTGVEMEALTAASVAALTVYDMCKSMDRTITVEQIRLEEKSGGKSGHFVRNQDSE